MFFNSAVSLSPSVPYGRLEQFTELVVSPKIRSETGNISGPVVRSSHNPHFDREQNFDFLSPLGPSERTSTIPHNHQWGGIADLKSLLRHMIKGSSDSVKEQPPVPDIPALLTDSVYRVCDSTPDSLCTISHVAASVIHLFSWNHSFTMLNGGLSPVTYGLLSRVESPKEARERTKQAMEKKKNVITKTDTTAERVEVREEEEAVVVRVVCHGTEIHGGKEKGQSKGEIHSGKVWVGMHFLTR